MKLTVLVPSPEYKTYAGARIRYRRMAGSLEQCGVRLVLTDIAAFDVKADDSDVVVISKCHDARAIVAAALLRDRGKLVGVDLFDDYFSQWRDSRLSRYRNWLAQLLPHCQFALCSTTAMAGVVRHYDGDIPIHVMNDPGPPIDADTVSELLDRKLALARDTRVLQLCWFGVGDNPHFRVGLDDVAAFAGRLRELTKTRMDVQLRLLTNPRALTANGLSSLRRLPIRVSVDAWTAQAEQALLAQSFVAFLPVSAQGFSAAKSLNRAVTALTAGCQVLSAGYPLYSVFDALIYRDPGKFATDLEAGTLRHSRACIRSYVEAMNAFASAEAEAARLSQFLSARQPPLPSEWPIALVHGHSTNGHAHKMLQAAGGLSVASPFCTAPLGFDVIFQQGIGSLAMLVSAKAARRLLPKQQSRLSSAATVGGRKFLELRDADHGRSEVQAEQQRALHLPLQLATYRHSMHEIRRRMEEAFGQCRLIVSETSPLPFPAAALAR